MGSDYTPRQVAELQRNGEIQLIDVREDEEWVAGRIAGARLIPLGQLSERAQEIDGSRTVVFYCRSGSRSAMATQAFERAGFDAHNMAGGLLDWAAGGIGVEPTPSHVARAWARFPPQPHNSGGNKISKSLKGGGFRGLFMIHAGGLVNRSNDRWSLLSLKK